MKNPQEYGNAHELNHDIVYICRAIELCGDMPKEDLLYYAMKYMSVMPEAPMVDALEHALQHMGIPTGTLRMSIPQNDYEQDIALTYGQRKE